MNVTMPAVISPKTLKELMTTGAVSSARVEPGDKGLLIFLSVGQNERVLGAARGGLRYFQSLDGVANALIGYGIDKFGVNVGHWVPKTMVRAQKQEQLLLAIQETV